MNEQRRSGHTVTRFTAHLVWVTKYRYPVLKGDIKLRCRELIIQICDADEKVQEYLEHHRNPFNKDNENMILE